VLGGSCHFNMSLFNRPDKRFPYNWFADGDAGVSALRNFGSHLLYMLCELLGPVAELVADDAQVLREWVFPDGDRIIPANTDYANLIIRFASGVTVSFQTSWSQSAQEGWTIDLFGTDGRLRARAPTFPTVADCTLEAGEAGSRDGVSLKPVPLNFDRHPRIAMDPVSNPAPSFPMAMTMLSLVEAIEGHGTPVPDFALALHVEQVQEAARISSTERRWMKLADIG
jgi:predicted dehydrogenase